MLTPITARTKVAGVIGDPVHHSRSPLIHNAAFAALDLDWRYVALPVRAGRGADAVDAMRVLGIQGLSVTMPHKADVAAAVDALTPAAENLGACNCLFRDGDRIIGDNTDGIGFVRSVEATGFSLVGTTVAVLGAGGAARSIIDAIDRAGASAIIVVNRSAANAASAAALAPSARVGRAADCIGADLVINTTSLGMADGPDPTAMALPADIADEVIAQATLIADIVYAPTQTPLLAAASARGVATVGGLPMLVYQAVAQFEHWTGLPAPVEIMLAAAT